MNTTTRIRITPSSISQRGHSSDSTSPSSTMAPAPSSEPNSEPVPPTMVMIRMFSLIIRSMFDSGAKCNSMAYSAPAIPVMAPDSMNTRILKWRVS